MPDPKAQSADNTDEPSWLASVMPIVPDHELIRRIGGGSYGDVWLARTALGTWRAVKVVFRDRFLDARPYEREFNGIQKFEPLSRSNEAFVDILQIGRNDAAGYFYYVMELADDADNSDIPEVVGHAKGIVELSTYVPKTLAKVLIQRGRLPVKECLELGLTLNLGLAHLHRAGLIHRDIKPSNIIFVGGVPKLADIGLLVEMSEARSFVGTEGFIPPEGPNSPQADLYSLGKVLYEAAMAKDRKDFPEPFTQIADGPDSAELLEFNAILLKACAASRDERYRTAEEMNADLALLQSGGSVRRQRKLAGQLRVVRRAGAVITVAAAVIALGWWWQAKQTRVVRELAIQKTQLAEENRDRVVRLGIANGVRLLDQQNPAPALLWFSDALQRLTNNSPEERMHRIRIEQTLAKTPRLLKVFPHQARLNTASFSPNGRRVVTGSMDRGAVSVWDVESSSRIWERQLDGPARFARFSHDGKRILVTSSAEQQPFTLSWELSQVAATFDADSGEELFSVSNKPGEREIRSAAFSPDDRWLAVTKQVKTDQSVEFPIYLFDVATGQQLHEWRGAHSDVVLGISFSADGSVMASGSADSTTRLWSLPSGQPLASPITNRLPVAKVILDDSGRYLLCGSISSASKESEITAWDVSNGRRLWYPRAFDDAGLLAGVEPGPDPRVFFSSGNPTVQQKFHHFKTGELLVPAFNMKRTECWDFSPDGKWMVFGGDDYRAWIFDRKTGETVGAPFIHGHWVMSARFSPDGRRLLTASADGIARVWDLSNLIENVLPRVTNIVSVQTSAASPTREGHLDPPTGSLLPIAILTDTWQLLNAESLTVSPLAGGAAERLQGEMIGGAYQPVWALNPRPFSSQNPQSSTIHLWSIAETSAPPKNLFPRYMALAHPTPVTFQAFASEDSLLITCATDGIVRTWKTADGTLQSSAAKPVRDGKLLAVEPSGKRALWIRGGVDNLLQWLDLDSGEFVGPTWHVPGVFTSVAFSPDHQFLGLGDGTGSIWLMKIQDGTLLGPLRHNDNLMTLKWAPDSQSILSAGGDIVSWNPRTGTQRLGALTLSGWAISCSWSFDGSLIAGMSETRRVRVWEATHGEAVTPELEYSGNIRMALITPRDQLVVVHEKGVEAMPLSPTMRPADVIADYARFLSGHRLTDSGVMLPLSPGELDQLQFSLNKRVPALFR